MRCHLKLRKEIKVFIKGKRIKIKNLGHSDLRILYSRTLEEKMPINLWLSKIFLDEIKLRKITKTNKKQKINYL
jgi:hypothetical protein